MLRWMDGFDHYGDSETFMLQGPYANVGNCTIEARPRSGTRSLKVKSLIGSFRRIFGADLDEVGNGYAFLVDSFPTSADGQKLAQILDNDADPVITLIMSSTGQIVAKRGPKTGTEIGRSSPVVYTGSFQHFEYNLLSDVSTGALEVRINGVTVLNLAGIDTRTHPAGGGGFSVEAPAQVLVEAGGLGTVDMWIDDFFCRDGDGAFNNTFVGDKKIYTVFPDADTATEQWVPSVGTDSYAILNNNPPVDTDFLNSDTAGQSTIVGLQDLPAEVVSIAAVYTASRLWKSDAGAGSVAVSLISAGTPETGFDHALSLAPTYYGDVFEIDPNTSAMWTLSGFNAAQYQIDRTL